MATLKVNAPDGKVLRVDVPEGTDPSQYDKMADDALADYTSSSEGPGGLKSAALGAMSGIPGAETVVSGIGALGDKTYEESHQNLEDLKDKAWDAHPVAYGTGKGAGMIGTGIVAPEGIPAMIGMGALSGVDAASNLSDAPKEALKGAAVGGVFGGVAKGLGKALESAAPAAKGMLASLGAKTSIDDIERYLANPEVVNAAATSGELGSKVAGLTGDITNASKQLSSGARELLSPSEAPVNIRDIKNLAMEALNKYHVEGNPATAADESAIKTIVAQYQRLADIAESNDGVVPQTTLREMLDHIQAATKDSTYGNPEAGVVQKALKEFGGGVNDLLRTTNPEYAAKMAPSAEAAKLSSDLQDTFKIEGKTPTDPTFMKVKNIAKEGKPEELDAATRLKNMTGFDLMEALKNTTTKENLGVPGAGGAMKALLATLGFGVGKFTGIPYGGIGGAAVGRFAADAVDGGNVAKIIMDNYLSMDKTLASSGIKAAYAKYGPALINAAKAGGNQLAATHFVLATSDPEYQKVVDHAQDNQQ